MIERAVLEYVANSIWQVPVLAAMTWIFIRLSKPGPRVQHSIWWMTLVLCILLPLCKRSQVTTPRALTNSGMLSAETQTPQILKPAENLDPASSPTLATPNARAAPVPWLPLRTLQLTQRAVDWFFGIYLAIVLSRLIQLVFGWRAARQLVMHAGDKSLSIAEQTALQQSCAKFRVPQPRVLISKNISSPMTIGAMRPALLLPDTFAENADGELLAIMCHELAHIRRRDYLANWICQLAALPIAYHPATLGVQHRIRQTRELVCDRMAADAMHSATGYARCLVTLAQRMLDGERLPQPVQSAGLFDHDVLEERIMRLLEKKPGMTARAKGLRIAGAVALAACAISLAAIFHVTPTVVNAAVTPPQTAKSAETNAQSSIAAPYPKAPVPPAAPIHAAVPRVATVPAPPVVAVPVSVRPVPVTVSAVTAIPIRVHAVVRLQVATPAPMPAPPVSPAPNARPAPSMPSPPAENPHPIAIPQSDQFDLTPEQRAQIEQEMAAANARIQEATKTLQSPEFKQQMADIQRQVAEAGRKLQSAEVQRQLHIVESPEFKQQMAEAQRQMADATRKLQSSQVQRQLAIVKSPEFKQQMAQAQRQMEEAGRKLQSAEVQRQLRLVQSPEFKKQMADMQRQLEEATKRLQSSEMQRELRSTPQTPPAPHVPANQKKPDLP